MSEQVQKIANYLVQSYEHITKTPFNNDELTLQKLMYFIQKTSFVLTGQPIIDEDFEGWKHGPVLPSLRYFLVHYTLDKLSSEKLTDTEKYIVDNTIHQYGKYAPWTLRNMSHNEKAWQNSRLGLADTDNGSKKIEIEDIKKDAEKVRLYDHQFDMYLDEFEDIAEEDFISVE